MGRTWGTAVLLLAVVGCTAGPTSEPDADPTSSEPLRVLFAGDSLTVGYYATTASESYAALLTAEWDAEVVRAEEAGARAWRVARGVEEFGPTDVDVAVLEVGANDVGKTPVGEYAEDYRRLVEAAERGAPEVVVCLGPWNDGDRSPAYDEVVAEVCDGDGRVHAPLSDLYDRPELHGPVGTGTHLGPRDDFHPNDAGHAAIAERVARVVERASAE